MTLRERVWEDFAADLEYHPKRGLLYLCLGVASFTTWFCLPSDLMAVRLVVIFGCAALLLKGLYLLRRSSEGLALSHEEREKLSDPSNRKELPPVPILAARVLQDFGIGPLLLGPALHALNNVNEGWALPSFHVFIGGAVLVAIGQIMRHLAGQSAGTAI